MGRVAQLRVFAFFLGFLLVMLYSYQGRSIRAIFPLQHAAQDFPVVSKQFIWSDLNTVTPSSGHVSCPLQPPGLVGQVTVSVLAGSLSWETLSYRHKNVEMGGKWSPPGCQSRHHLHLIVPYRDRETQLKVFVDHMHPFLQRQLIQYRIVVVEQSHSKPFNRAKLFNVGHTESLQLSPSPSPHCFIFTDVDLLPENDFNIYGCSHQPRHASSAIDIFRYNLPYPELFGGVSALSGDQFKAVNGFSNRFFGWGGEDDDMFNRIISKGMNITRWDSTVARYKMLRHAKAAPSNERYAVLEGGDQRMESDGLNSLIYTRKAFEERPLYTWILVDL